jgi:hypothetical protein
MAAGWAPVDRTLRSGDTHLGPSPPVAILAALPQRAPCSRPASWGRVIGICLILARHQPGRAAGPRYAFPDRSVNAPALA